MLVAIVTDEYPPAKIAGGIGMYTLYLGQLLSRGRHQVHVFCQQDGISKPSNEVLVHPVRAWEPPSRLFRFLYFRSIGGFYSPLQRRARWGLAVGRQICHVERVLKRRFDVVEVPVSGGYAGFLRLAGVRSAILARMHVGTLTLHRHGAGDGARWVSPLSRLERWSLRAAALISAPSRAVVREEVGQLGIRSTDRVLIYPNPTSYEVETTDCAELARDERLVLTVGRLCALKGTDLVIEAFASLRSEGVRLRLVMIGRNIMPPEMVARAASVGLSAHSGAFVGEVSPAQVRWWMRRAGIVIVASRFESFSLVAVEALRAGALVIASSAGALPELIKDRVTGLLFQTGSFKDLAATIRWACDHPLECATIGRTGQTWAARYLAEERVLASVVHAYEQAQARAGAIARVGIGESLTRSMGGKW